MCGRGASAPAQKRPTPTAHATRRRRPVAMVLVPPAVRALGRGLLLAQHHPPLHMRVRCAAIQRGAQAGAAGACVSAAPAGVPRGRRAFKKAAKVAGKGTSLPGGAFEHIFANWVATGLNCATWHNSPYGPCQPLCTYKISGPKAQWFKRKAGATAKPFFQPEK